MKFNKIIFLVIFCIIINFTKINCTITCIKCNSAETPNCSNKPDTVSTDCTDDEKCVTYVNAENKLFRDCYSSVKANIPNCDTTGTCKTCTGNKCNNEMNFPKETVPLQCYACDSGQDKNCAHLKDLSKLTKNNCTECAIKINEKGHTIRGCKKDILNNENCKNDDKLCYNCTTTAENNPCNGIKFPNDRRQCYQCENCKDITNQDSLICSIYKIDDKCYIYPSINDNVKRGCISDEDDSKICENAGEKCYKCDTNNCNGGGTKKCPKLKCIQCDSSKDNDDCKWGFNQDQNVWCNNQIDYWKTETCYTCNIDGNVTRGCEWDASTALSDKCKKCTGDGCNQQNENEFTCKRCRSDNPGEESCGKDGADIKPSACKNPVTKTDRGCFTDKDVETGVIIRGCLVDFDIKDRLKCKDEKYEYCKSCLESNCNNHTLSSSGVQNKFISSSILLFFVIFSLFIQFLW